MQSAGLRDLELALEILGDVSYILQAPPRLLSHLIFTIGVTLTEDAGDQAQKTLGAGQAEIRR